LTNTGATFEVSEGATSPYGSTRPFELEAILDDCRRRADEWATVHEVIADMDSTIRMNRDPGDREEIKINREAWRLLCELGSGASVSLMAERLGTTDFWIAKVAAEMADQKLLVLTEAISETEAPISEVTADVEEVRDANESWWVEPQAEEPVADPSVASVDPSVAPVDEEQEAAPSEPVKDSRFGHFVRATLQEPVAPVEESVADAVTESFAPAAPESFAPAAPESFAPTAPEAEAAGDVYDETPVFEPVDETEDVEEDTEAFLEKVFSQLEVNGQADVEEEGHGLLRRRRMGSVLKEIDEN
ncbi:MAG TPA: hypothetical protein VLS86_00560, partial [Acidimicrobiia bacterium]|nr:hypothetical protein [Acidimicrobiia bacterium]